MHPSLISRLLEHLGILPGTWRSDANETLFIARDLEQVLEQAYDVIHPELKAKKFIPMSNKLDPGAETFLYKSFDIHGMAKIITDYADDLPSVDAFVTSHAAKIVTCGAEFSYSIQELQAAAMGKVQLEDQKVKAARRAIERKEDDILATGDADAGIEGFINNSNVTVVDRINGAWDATTTAEEMRQDLVALVEAVRIASDDAFPATDIILDPVSFGLANNMPVSALQPNITVLKAFVENSDSVKNIDHWGKLSTADADGTGRRWIAYHKSPEVVEGLTAVPFTPLAPQPKNLSFTVPCWSRLGGSQIRYPIGMAYMDPDIAP